jgi:GNAT superfamily N-acetyltransferase
MRRDMPRQIRAPKTHELTVLTDLCMRSKAVWGYNKEFMDACHAELTINLGDLNGTEIAVAEEGGKVVGIAQVEVKGTDADLLKLFVEPGLIGSGVGAALFRWAASRARELGADRLFIDSDPGAVPFYRRMGAQQIGNAPSGSIPGRTLPKLALDIRP